MPRKTGLSRVAQLDEREVLRDEGFRAALQALAESQQRALPDVEEEARKALAELSVRPADRYLGWVASLARFMVTRSFEPEFDVNTDALEVLKEQAKERPLVFLWSHKSHLDSFVFMKALYDAKFVPQPLSFAGINMAFAGFASLARNSGAIFLRRSFKDDEVYKLVLKYFIDYLVAKKVPLSWSIEGTRSRTGKLMPPRLGLIQWVVDSCKRASCDDALLVPVAISFDQIPEIDDYIAMQQGKPKRKESLKWFVDYIAGMKAKYGKIYVRFAEPVALSHSVSVSDAMLQDDAGRAQIQKLAFEVSSRIENAKPINPTDLITLVLLGANGRGLDAGQISRQASAIIDRVEARGLPTAGDLRDAMGARLQAQLDALTGTELLERYEDGAAPIYQVSPGRQLAAAYYRNTIVHYFLSSAIAEVALALAPAGSSRDDILDEAMALRDLLKFEFFFKVKAAFRDDATEYLDARYEGWRNGKCETRPDEVPLFGPGILRSFVEAYRILALLLMNRGGQVIDDDDRVALVGGCLNRGEEMLRRKEISTEAALAQPMFETAIRLAAYRRLLQGDPDELRERRQAFVAELERIVAAIERLQDNCDASLGFATTNHNYEQRSIA